MANQLGIDLSHRIEPSVSIVGSDDIIRQIVTNLFLNALTHGFEGIPAGRITVRFRRNEAGMVLEFSDDGRGMGEDVRKKIFEPFYTTRRQRGGTGLGLHIVYNLVTQRLKGGTTCETSPGKGARFLIEIPSLKETAA